MNLDDLDRKALSAVLANARISWADLAQHLGLSAPAAADRIRRLEERGVIRGYTARLDAESLGLSLTAFVAVTLDKPAHRGPFLKRVEKMPEIAECHHIAGDDDYLLKVHCGGTRDLDRLLSEELKALPGVVRTRTTIVLSTPKDSSELPLRD
jgi:Lrp/AsnC family leucine-responsive transcriptional regulator